jgi:hypothetical protein
METLKAEAFMVIVTPMAITQLQVGLLTKLVAALSVSVESAVFLQDKIIMSEYKTCLTLKACYFLIH